jgi:molybdate transport system ATP-binding protein
LATLSVEFTLPLRSFELELALEVGRTVALVGPSGAGKTSALRAIAGLARPTAGRIALDGDVWFDALQRVFSQPDERRVGLVFQEYALFPHMDVRQNVAYGGKDRVDELLERFRISHLVGARTTELSGGERQRVALARALAREPGVLLLDEPLAALDARTKSTVRPELQALLRELSLPTLLVTHDYEDAAALADEVGVIVDGRLRQLATPQALVARPADAFVASFTGANVLLGKARRAENGLAVIRLETGEDIYSAGSVDGDVGVVVYPWEIALDSQCEDGSIVNGIRGEISSVALIGNRVRAQVGPLIVEAAAASVGHLRLVPGSVVVAYFKATDARLVKL